MIHKLKKFNQLSSKRQEEIIVMGFFLLVNAGLWIIGGFCKMLYDILKGN